ncbi:hypothetical protein, partial [Ruminococcus sp. CAG:330]|uniref:hypothetical protein n=1 Tax=Ruminococcus sp. CAG:330 TaxID=1262954 RepID=UPI00263F819C
RGRSEQDRSALYPACCATILETFRRNVFNGICVDTKTNFCFVKLADTARRVPTNRLKPSPSLSGEAKDTAQPFRQASCFDLRDFLSIPIDELGGIVL